MLNILRKQFLGELDNVPCWTAECTTETEPPDGYTFHNFRRTFGIIEDRFWNLAGRAYQIMHWDRSHQFCSRCGHKVIYASEERAKVCQNCQYTQFPRHSPAIIVAIIKGDQILLARAKRFPSKMYSVLAGFVEPGESLEECLHREVEEEAGIRVKNIRYFGSQSWPFPHSLMIAFTAEYASGEIKVYEKELVDARWFHADALPKVPDSASISRRLIDWFVKNSK